MLPGVWRQTKEEVEKGWTWFDETCEPLDKLLAKRFGLQQGEKVRLIDDCTIGGFNGACGSTERLRLHAVDEMAAYMAWCLSNLPADALREVEKCMQAVWCAPGRSRQLETGGMES